VDSNSKLLKCCHINYLLDLEVFERIAWETTTSVYKDCEI